MIRRFLMGLSILVLASGCTRTSRSGIISQSLPLTLDDLSAIRDGERNHEEVLLQYDLYHHDKMQVYLNTIASHIAEVSTRPNLPYKVYLLDTEEVNMFGGPGGFVYISKGMLEFVQSESEIAGIMAHEIAHIANHEYDNIPAYSKVQKVYGALLKGSELAKDSIGTYGTVAHYGVKGIGKATPAVMHRFGRDQEVVADKAAIEYLMKAGYDPRGLQQFIDRLSRIPISEVNRFVLYMNSHPPFSDRQVVLHERMEEIKIEDSKIEFKEDTLNEVRKMMMTPPAVAAASKPKGDTELFQPTYGADPMNIRKLDQTSQDKDDSMKALRKQTAWF